MPIRNFLSWLLFRKYNFFANGYNYTLRVPRWRITYNHARATEVANYCAKMISNGTVPLIHPALKVYVDVVSSNQS